jgi:hypothetical protein
MSWWRLYARPWIWEHWPCPSCGTPLRFDISFRWLVAILCLGSVFYAIPRHFHPRWYVILFLGAAIMLQVNRVSVAKPSDKSERQHNLPEPPKDA